MGTALLNLWVLTREGVVSRGQGVLRSPHQGVLSRLRPLTSQNTHVAIFDGAGGKGRGRQVPQGLASRPTTLAAAVEDLASDASFADAIEQLSVALGQ